VIRRPGFRMMVPLVILAVLSVIGGFVELPANLGNMPFFSEFMRTALPLTVSANSSVNTEIWLQCVAGLVSLAGIFLAYFFFLRYPNYALALATSRPGSLFHRFWFKGWGFDWVYDRLIVRPFVWAARINKDDFIDLVYIGTIWISRRVNRTLSLTQTGKVRWYAMGIVIGAIVTLAMVVLL
jgi:NADH-quinone oxidoreductase subunit L